MATIPLTIRIGARLKAVAQNAAKDDTRSLSSVIVKLLSEYLKNQSDKRP